MAKNGSSWLTRVYNVVDRDPEIDNFQTVFNKERGLKENDLAVLSGLSSSTVKNLFSNQKTKRPQHATFAKLASAMGYKYGLSRDAAPNYERELPKAREEFKAHKEALKKKRERAEKRAKQ